MVTLPVRVPVDEVAARPPLAMNSEQTSQPTMVIQILPFLILFLPIQLIAIDADVLLPVVVPLLLSREKSFPALAGRRPGRCRSPVGLVVSLSCTRIGTAIFG
ncbi:hypothetical protein GURASL_17820 [Geotalea uraniireducens]|uniref:Uncharacterized protein n=1 Tax=Geotalea uraniireducens TaxID=351604 RepID=A0ABM8EK37_9BACT|nr:hypothetical protein GURASL_17820 [Geotalea uraniireducens]